MDWTPETNRVPTCLLTADELAALKAAKHGWLYTSDGIGWFESDGDGFSYHHVYRANPAPALTLSITVNGVTNVVAAGVTEALEMDAPYWLADTLAERFGERYNWGEEKLDHMYLSRGLVHRTEAAARAHAMAMVGLKAEVV